MISLHYITCHLNRSHFDKRCLICWLWNCCINLSLCLHISQKSHCAILSKYLSICWWKASKNTLLYFWNPLVTSATASLHPKWIMQWWFHSMVLLNWSLALWQVGKKKKVKAECLVGGLQWVNGFLKVMLSWMRKQRSTLSIGFFDSIISRSGSEHVLMSLASGQAVQVLLHLSKQASWEIVSETSSSYNVMSFDHTLEQNWRK